MNKNKKERLLENGVIVERAQMVSCLLDSIGEDKDRDGLKETPLRVAAMYDELFKGYHMDPEQLLRDAMFVDEGKKNLVLVRNIRFASTCEHHMMPFFGTINIAYIPQDGKIVGLSKLCRVVEACSKKLQVQERLGNEILNTIKNVMNPFGIAVIIEAEHTCMTVRGVQQPGTTTITSALDGVFYLDDKARTEVLSLINKN